MPVHKVGPLEAVSLLLFFGAAKIFLAFPRRVVELAGTGAWLTVLVAALVAALTCLALSGLARQYPKQSLIGATEIILGPVLGTAVNLVYFAYFHFLCFTALRQFAENIASTILPRTPLPVLVFTFLAAGAYAALLGLEGIARVAWMMAPFSLITLTALLAGGWWSYHAAGFLTPVWGYGLPFSLGVGVVKSALFGDLLLAGLLVPHFRGEQRFHRIIWSSLLGAAALMFTTVVIYLAVFPWPSGARIGFPLLEISRLIITGRWVQRLESLFFVMWVAVATLQIGAGIWATSVTLAQTMKLNNYRHLVLPLALTIYSLAMLPTSLIEAVSWDTDFLRVYGGIVSVLLPLLTWVVDRVRHKEAARAS